MGEIDFLATSVNYRGQGVATMMKEVEPREPTLSYVIAKWASYNS